MIILLGITLFGLILGAVYYEWNYNNVVEPLWDTETRGYPYICGAKLMDNSHKK